MRLELIVHARRRSVNAQEILRQFNQFADLLGKTHMITGERPGDSTADCTCLSPIDSTADLLEIEGRESRRAHAHPWRRSLTVVSTQLGQAVTAK
eukprot:2877650-Pleurochrysis_carterae.AAC.2